MPIVGRINYSSGSFVDMVVESFAGPHDLANHPWFYSEGGWTRAGTNSFLRNLGTNYTTSLMFASPFAAAAIIEQTNLQTLLPATKSKP
jgi:hypothetical protein